SALTASSGVAKPPAPRRPDGYAQACAADAPNGLWRAALLKGSWTRSLRPASSTPRCPLRMPNTQHPIEVYLLTASRLYRGFMARFCEASRRTDAGGRPMLRTKERRIL